MSRASIQSLPIAVLGAGSWGTALAIHLARHTAQVNLWEYDKAQALSMQRDRQNKRYLPEVKFPSNLQVFESLKEALQNVQDILVVVPSFAFRQTLTDLKPFIAPTTRLLWATKGIDPTSNQLLHETVLEILGERSMAVLSGPSFAKEMISGLPTAVTLASNDLSFAEAWVARLNYDAFRVYTNKDMVGAQMGGAVKNVIAIAVGACDGLALGANARSALITRGLAEMMRLGVAMGAASHTFMGLSGMGDLVLTCTDDQSRNRRLGLALAQGETPKEFEVRLGQVVEGVHNVSQVLALAARYQVEMPVCAQVSRVLKNPQTLKEVVSALMMRSPKSEF